MYIEQQITKNTKNKNSLMNINDKYKETKMNTIKKRYNKIFVFANERV